MLLKHTHLHSINTFVITHTTCVIADTSFVLGTESQVNSTTKRMHFTFSNYFSYSRITTLTIYAFYVYSLKSFMMYDNVIYSNVLTMFCYHTYLHFPSFISLDSTQLTNSLRRFVSTRFQIRSLNSIVCLL